tara:strand:- start:106 stop:528 length:423 start_codon:yes stop_codon:yes gene_type:complete
MINYYSKVNPEKLICTITKKEDITQERQNITPDSEFMQVGAKKTLNGDFFKPHKHLPCNKHVTKTQEAWVILNGSAEGVFYDLDDSYLNSIVLHDGDCAVIYDGGHSLKILENDTLLYEFKNGPYFGRDKDKVFIGGHNE